MIRFKKIKLFKKANICYCDIIQDNLEKEIILHFDIILKYKLKNGLDVDLELYEKIIYENDLMKAKNLSYTFATYKMRTEKEVKSRLFQKGYNEDIINKCIEFLYEFKLLDDEKYANLFANEKAISKSWGKIRIKNELMRKGVNEEYITKALNSSFPEEESFEKGLKIAEKKYNTLIKRYDENKSNRLLFAFLQRRGFEFEVIKNIMNKIKS